MEGRTKRPFFRAPSFEGTDRRGLLGDVAKTITETATDIQHADMRATDGGMTAAFAVEVQNLSHLKRVMEAVRRVKGGHLGGTPGELWRKRVTRMIVPRTADRPQTTRRSSAPRIRS